MAAVESEAAPRILADLGPNGGTSRTLRAPSLRRLPRGGGGDPPPRHEGGSSLSGARAASSSRKSRETRTQQGAPFTSIAVSSSSHQTMKEATRQNWSAAGSRRMYRPRAGRGTVTNLPSITATGGDGGSSRHHHRGGPAPSATTAHAAMLMRGSPSSRGRAPAGHLTMERQRTLRCGVCSIQGLKPGNPAWRNQDGFIVHEHLSDEKDDHVFAVLDGHGEVGHFVSQRCRDVLCSHFLSADKNFTRTFKAMQQDLDECTFDVKCSGATCVFAFLSGSHLKIANLGDSRGVLGHLHGGVVCAIPMTSDHKPDRPDEHRRILACGGRVSCRQLVVGQGSNGPITLPLGPSRVWYKRHQSHGDTMGLAMSRSFGDSIVHGLGVSSEPEVTERHLDQDDFFLICATDGIWDVIDNNQAVQIVHNHLCARPDDWDVAEAAHALCVAARRRWEALSPMIDDITAVIVDLRPRSSNR